MSNIDFDLEGWAEARKKIHDMRERARNYTPVWNELLDWWAHQNRLHFGSRGARWKSPWKELSPAYLAAKRAEGWQGDTLVRTSDLLRSLSDRPLGIESVSPFEVTAGTRLSYARHHQDGTKYMPRRRLINAEQVRAEGVVSEIAANWITQGRAIRNP